MTVRWGILGTSAVARKFAFGLHRLPDAALTRVASGRPANAVAFARDLGVAGVSDTAEDLAANNDVDVVYIATPPSLHRTHALACMAAGKAVLVEKPFAPTVEDARAMIAAARQHGVFCMEGMWTRFLPLVRELKSRLEAGEIGELRGFSGSFCAPDIPDPARNLFRPEMGGGALLHRGIYPLSLACHLMGAALDQQNLVRFGATGVDEDALVILRHEGGGISSSASSLRAAAANGFAVTGTKGMIAVGAPIYRPFRMTLTKTPARVGRAGPGNARMEALKEGGLMQGANQRLSQLAGLIRGRRSKTILKPFAGNGYHYEAQEVMTRMATGGTESPLMPLDESLALAGIMEKALRRSDTDT